MGREAFLRGDLKINQQVTARCLDRVADWLDIADSETVTAVYPQLPETSDALELACAWMWAAVLIADMTDPESDILHKLATAIRSSYREGED